MASSNTNKRIGGHNLSVCPQLIRIISKDFSSSQRSNYLRGCKWSPDGSCLLTCSQDNCLRVFELEYIADSSNADSSHVSALCLPEPELIYDYTWYPGMQSSEPITNCIASIARDNPVHLWDAYTGVVRCSYLLLNQVQEVITPYSLLFSLDGTRLYCGYKHNIKYFHTDKPGPNSFNIKFDRKSTSDLNGIVSSLALSTAVPACVAAGSYGGKVLLVDCNSEILCQTLQAQPSGVNLVKFSPDGKYLLSGARGSNDIFIWDVRYANELLTILDRDSVTQQLIEYDINDSFIVSGNKDGYISVWNTGKVLCNSPELQSARKYKLHCDVINGVSMNLSYSVLATASGEKLFSSNSSFSTDSDSGTEGTLSSSGYFEHCVKLWSTH